MKKMLWVLSFVLAITISVACAEEDEEPQSICPKTLISDQARCFACHSMPRFKVRESPEFEGYSYPNSSTWLAIENGKTVGHYFLDEINSEAIDFFYNYLNKHKIKDAIIEIHSPGGSMMQSWRIIGIMEKWHNRGIKTTTKVHGYAASAGFLIMVAGDERLVSPNAMLMWHEVQTFKMFDFSSPSDKEEEARVLRFFQDIANKFLAERSNLTKDEIDKLIKKKEYWISGEQAVEYGFADKLM